MKDIKEDINRWKDIPWSLIGRLNIVKMTVLPKATYRFNAICVEINNGIFHRTRTKKRLQFVWKQKTQIAKAVLEKKDGFGGIRLPDFSVYYKATVIKTVWYWHKNRSIDHWNRIENPELSPGTYGHLIYDKGGRSSQCWRDSLLKWCWENGQLHIKNEIKSFFNSIHKNKLKTDSRPKCETRHYKASSRKHRTLSDINHSNIFFNLSPRTMEIKTKINKWDLLKLKSFWTAKETKKKKTTHR